MDKYTVQDLINYSYAQQPIEFDNAFQDILTDKIAAAVDNKKFELSQTMFTGEDPEFEDDEWDDEETESEEE
jgi:hypothetical protein